MKVANHSNGVQFLKRLLDIAPLLKLAEKVQDYYVGIGNNSVFPPSFHWLKHLFYKPLPPSYKPLTTLVPAAPEYACFSQYPNTTYVARTQSELCLMLPRLKSDVATGGGARGDAAARAPLLQTQRPCHPRREVPPPGRPPPPRKTVELIPTLGAFLPRGGPVQDPVLSREGEKKGGREGGRKRERAREKDR